MRTSVKYKERILGFNSKELGAKIKKLQNDFAYAVACYENGDIDEAKEYFENIVSCAPKMNHSIISRKYLEAIEGGLDCVIIDMEVLPDETYEIYDERTASKIRRHKIIRIACIIVTFVLLLLSAISNNADQKNNNEVRLFEAKLNDAIEENYDQAKKLFNCNVKKNGVNVDSICLIDVNGHWVMVEIASGDGGQTLTVLEIQEHVIPDVYYCNESPVSGYYIGYMVSQKQPHHADALYHLLEFETDGGTYWFYIDYIETTPKS